MLEKILVITGVVVFVGALIMAERDLTKHYRRKRVREFKKEEKTDSQEQNK